MNDSDCLREELRTTKVSRLEGEGIARRVNTVGPWNSGIDLIPEGHHFDPEGIDYGACCLSTGDDEIADAGRGKMLRDATEGLFNIPRCPLTTERYLHSRNGRGLGGRVDQQ